MNLAQHLEVFYGAASSAEARVYARLPRMALASFPDAAANDRFQLVGEVVGPRSDFAHCLPARVPLREPHASPNSASDGNPGSDALLAAAVVPDPCFWLPEEPYYYTVRVELKQAGKTVAQIERTLGIRPLGIHANRFYLLGKPWVARAVNRVSVSRQDLEDARLLGATLLLSHPPDDLCHAASRNGVLVMAALESTENSEQLANECRRLADHPAVAFLVAPVATDLSGECLAALRNVLIGCRLTLAEIDQLPPWARFALVEWPEQLSAESLAKQLSQLRMPVCVEQVPAAATLAAARAGCDALQAQLAGLGDFAGYAH